MIEQLIEKRIIDAVNALNLPGLAVSGIWQPVGDGAVKGMEGADHTAALAVSVGPRTFDTFTVCECSFDVRLALVVRLGRDATGNALVEYAGGILDLLTRWNMDEYGDWCAELAVDGFDPSGIRVDTGEGPSIDRDAGIATVDFGFTLKGSVAH